MSNKEIMKEYNRIRRNLTARIRRLEKKGYLYQGVVPEKPKRVTAASIRRLEQINKTLLDKSVFVDIETGEIISTGTEARNRRRIEAARKAAQTRKLKQSKPQSYEAFPSEEHIALSNFLAELNTYSNSPLYPYLVKWINFVRKQYGDDYTGRMIIDGKERGYILTWETLYKTGEMNTYISHMMEFIPDAGSLEIEGFWDAYEQTEDWDFIRDLGDFDFTRL